MLGSGRDWAFSLVTRRKPLSISHGPGYTDLRIAGGRSVKLERDDVGDGLGCGTPAAGSSVSAYSYATIGAAPVLRG
jgi:hypothetical protein